MSLTRKFLKEIGIDETTADNIINEHMTSITGIQNDLQEAKDEVGKAEAIQQEIDSLKEYKSKYETEKAEHEKLRAEVDSASAAKAKNDALRAYFESKNITGDNINIAMRAVSLDSVEMNGDKIKDTTALDDLVAGDLKPLVSAESGGGVASEKENKTRIVDSGAKSGVNDHGGRTDYSLRGALRESYDMD